MSKNDEVERIRKIRDRQLKLRDHSVEQKQLQRQIATKRRSRAEKFSWRRMFGDIPKMVTGTLIGMLIGILVFLVLPYLSDGAWIDYVGIGLTVFGTALGFFIGRALDARDSLSDI